MEISDCTWQHIVLVRPDIYVAALVLAAFKLLAFYFSLLSGFEAEMLLYEYQLI